MSLADEFTETVRHIPAKAAGGCLVIAYSFWLWIQDRASDEQIQSFDIVQYKGFSSENVDNNLAWINGDREFADSGSHFTWMFEGQEYDGNGPYGRSDRVVLSALSELDMIDDFCISALNHGDWNPSFERETGIPELEYCLDICLGDINQ